MKRKLKKTLGTVCLIMVASLICCSTIYACSISSRNMSVDGHWHHNWTILPFINYWQSSIMSASASFKSDSGHVIQPYMTVKRGSIVYVESEQRSSWSLTVNNKTLTGDMSNKNWGICEKKDVSIAKRTVFDKVWGFDNLDPRSKSH